MQFGKLLTSECGLRCDPLFLGPGTEAKIMGCFRFGEGNYYSAFPVVVSSLQFPDVLFTLFERNESALEGFKEAIKDFVRDPPLKTYDLTRLSHNEAGIYMLDEGTTDLQKKRIINEVLVPAGIGAFWGGPGESCCPVRFETGGQWYMAAPYSIHQVRQILFCHDSEKDTDLDPFSVLCLRCLKYPIPHIIIPRPDLARLRDRYIFCEMMLRNPPPFPQNGRRRTVELKAGKNNLGIKVAPFQWVWMYSGVTAFPGFGPMIAYIGDPLEPAIDLLASGPGWTGTYHVACAFVDNVVALMSPRGGELHINEVIAAPGFVDVCISSEMSPHPR
jgi:hypothetical protein